MMLLDWLFLRLNKNLVVEADTQYYHFDRLDLVLGVFRNIIENSKLIDN